MHRKSCVKYNSLELSSNQLRSVQFMDIWYLICEHEISYPLPINLTEAREMKTLQLNMFLILQNKISSYLYIHTKPPWMYPHIIRSFIKLLTTAMKLFGIVCTVFSSGGDDFVVESIPDRPHCAGARRNANSAIVLSVSDNQGRRHRP